MREVYGEPYAYFETGTEGVYWAVTEDNVNGYEGLHVLREGDHLTIYKSDEDNQVIFSDFIKKDVVTNLRSHPFNPSYKQQVALGMWVHWIQEDWDPDEWAKLFVGDKHRARLFLAPRQETNSAS